MGSVKIWKGLWRRDVGLEMLKAGVAAVLVAVLYYDWKHNMLTIGFENRYESKTGAGGLLL